MMNIYEVEVLQVDRVETVIIYEKMFLVVDQDPYWTGIIINIP